MAWSPGTKVPLIVYTAILFLGVAAADTCCKRSVLCYTTGAAVPPECVKSTCFEASIHIEKPDVNSAQFLPYFPTTTKIGTLTIIDSKDIAPLMFKSLVEVVHKGPGPAIFLEDADLHESSFEKLTTITVDDIRPYCVNKDLVVVKGNSKEIWKDRLESVANKMLSKCSTLTTTVATTNSILTTTTTKTTKMAGNQTTSVRSSTNSPLVCAPAQTDAKAGSAVGEDKVCPINYILVAVAVVALLIMILGLVIVYIWASRMAALKEKQEKKTEIALASISSYATQLICTIMATQSEHDHKILESIPLFRPSKVARLRNQMKFWHRISITQLDKFKSNKIVNPEVDFAKVPKYPKDDGVKVLDANPEFDEALRKLEIVKKAHVAGEQFQAPKDTKVVSDFRRKNPTEDMKVLAKKCGVLPKEPENGKKLKENAKQPWKGYEKKPEEQNRKKAGEDTPLSKTNTTTPKAEQKRNESKKVAPKMEDKKNEAPEIEPLPQLLPLGRVDRKNCKPLVIAPNSPVYFPEFDMPSKVLRDAFTVFTLMCHQFDKFFVTHKEVLVILNEACQQTTAISDREILETVGIENKDPKSKLPSNKTEKPICKDVLKDDFDVSKFFDELVQLRAKCDSKDKELYNLLEEQERIRALRLHSAAKNYFYFFDKTTRLNEAILPGETPLTMRKRHIKEKQVARRIGILCNARHWRINPVKKVPRDYVEMKKALPHPTGPDDKIEKCSKNKNKKK